MCKTINTRRRNKTLLKITFRVILKVYLLLFGKSEISGSKYEIQNKAKILLILENFQFGVLGHIVRGPKNT